MEEAVEKVLKFGSIHQIANKRCEVKNATPKGSGPVGVRPDFPGTNIAGGRGYFPRGGYQVGMFSPSSLDCYFLFIEDSFLYS